ncbi:TPA: hypothetical protein JBI49_06880 [Legionella pneumophila]|nr:hypothetical protein [Legionella pneumophila]HAU1389691.1 hypothetical protein [Legionella pneumophila]HBD7416116.1 hypothetical protein [Legionella pneumophila]HBD9398980.1 hypothetical protein [Legionella pneumophila]
MCKEINIIWVGPQRLPYKYLQHLKKWHNLNPDHQINFITDEHSSSIQLPGINTIHWKLCFDLTDVRQEFLLKEAERALQEKAYATLSNIVRKVKIFNDGGYYFDTDIVPMEKLPTVTENTPFLSQPKASYGEEFAKHRFVVSALYGSKHSPVFNEALTVMHETYQVKSLQDAIRENPEKTDYLRSYYSASLMLSRSVKRLYTNEQDYQKMIEDCQNEFGNPTAFQIIQDGSWGEGLNAVLMESKHLAATAIQRFFRATQALNQVNSNQSTSHMQSSEKPRFF